MQDGYADALGPALHALGAPQVHQNSFHCFPFTFPSFSRCFPMPPARFSGTLCTLTQHPPHWPFGSGSTFFVPFTVPGLLRYIYNSCIYPLDKREEVSLSPSVHSLVLSVATFLAFQPAQFSSGTLVTPEARTRFISKTSNVLNSLKTLISLEKYGLETA